MKVHLAKKFSNGKVSTLMTECGKHTFSRNNQMLMIAKTNSFKETMEKYKCINCNAKLKNRI